MTNIRARVLHMPCSKYYSGQSEQTSNRLVVDDCGLDRCDGSKAGWVLSCKNAQYGAAFTDYTGANQKTLRKRKEDPYP